MLLAVVLLWALNISVTRYVVQNGFEPLAYATIRYGAAVALFWVYTWWRERSFRVSAADLKLVFLAALLIYLNQVSFVTSVHLTSASTVGLVLGTTPVFVGILATLVGLERLGQAFWVAAVVSFLGVGLIAAGASGGSDRRPARRRARGRDRGDVGRVLGRRRAADEAVLAVPDQRARARDRLGAARADQHPRAPDARPSPASGGR